MNRSGHLHGLWLLAFGMLLTGCAGSPPAEDSVYLLRPDVPISAPGSGEPLRLKSVLIPPYLDQRGLVLQTGNSEIEVARHHRWAEPLDEAVERYLQVAITRQSGRTVETAPLTGANGSRSLTVRIHQFHGTAAGRVRLVADWRITEGDRSVIHEFDETRTQTANGYPALVAAHAELLEALAAAIARALD